MGKKNKSYERGDGNLLATTIAALVLLILVTQANLMTNPRQTDQSRESAHQPEVEIHLTAENYARHPSMPTNSFGVLASANND